jgi:hypothetical protein
MALADEGCTVRFLVRDRDAKFTAAFDEVVHSEGTRVIRRHPSGRPGPRRTRQRWVRIVRRECLDWILILGCRHLERVLRTHVTHYNVHRPHRALAQNPPLGEPRPTSKSRIAQDVRRRDRLGGLLHEYALAA